MVRGASGRAILAFLDDSIQSRVVTKLQHDNDNDTDTDTDDEDAILDSLADVRATGFAVSHDELGTGIHGIAVPVKSEHGQARASLGIIVPAFRAEGLLQHIDALMRATHTITAHLEDET